LQAKKTMNSQGNTEQKRATFWGITIPDFKLYYRAIAKKNSTILAQKQTLRPMEQNRGPGYESTQLCPPDFWQRCQKHTMEKRQLLQQMLLGKLDICLRKIETRSVPITLYKYQLKVDLRLVQERAGNIHWKQKA
jgi:hypothetical protein